MKLTDGSRICNDCECHFRIDEGEKQYFESLGYPLPHRCPECRRLRKEQQRQEAIDLASEQLGP